jgi:hypothetical protein
MTLTVIPVARLHGYGATLSAPFAAPSCNAISHIALSLSYAHDARAAGLVNGAARFLPPCGRPVLAVSLR